MGSKEPALMFVNQKNKNIIIAFILSAAVALIYMYDFYYMVSPDGVSNSDVKIQIGYMLHWYEEGRLPDMCQAYPLYYIVLRVLYRVIRNWVTVIMLFTGAWSFVTNLIQILFVRLMCGGKLSLYSILTGSALSFIWPISFKYSFFGGRTYWEMPLEQVFLTSGATSPDHSLTYLFVKPFALIALYMFIRILEEERLRSSIMWAVGFAICFFLSVIAKPCFYQAFAPAGFIAVIVYLCRNGLKSFFRCLLTGIAYLPATGWVLYAMRYKLAPYKVSWFEGISIFSDGTPLTVVLFRAIVFCIFVGICIVTHREWNNLYLIAFITYLFGILEFIMLIETENPEWLSMSWGYYIGMYVFFAGAIVAFYKLLSARNSVKERILYITGSSLIAVHALFGVIVFIYTWLPWWQTRLGI